MVAPAVDQCVHVHLGTQEDGVRPLVPLVALPVITLVTVAVVSGILHEHL